MPCRCSNKRKRKIKKIMQRRLLETENFKIVKSMKNKLPTSLKDKQLLDYHKKTHMLYAGNIKRTPINKKFVNSIVELHDRFVKEMLSRRMKHKTPLKRI